MNNTAIAYYRYSSHRQGEQSIEGQAAEAQKWAKANGYTLVKEYADRAMTGTNDDREQFQLMLKELERLHPDVLILWKVDRMGRNKEEIAFNKYRCKKNGVKIVYVAENIPDTPEGIILESVLEGMAEYYSLQLSQNIRRGQQASAAKCQSTGGNRPLGYRTGADKRFEIDPQGAAIVRQVFDRYVHGESQAEIVQALNAQGLRTLKGKPFTHNSLRTMLKNEKYIGVYSYKDTVRIEGGIPAIIDPQTFAKAQEMMKKNKRAPSHRWSKANYLLTEKLFCGRCGGMMVGISGTGRHGDKHYYYACTNSRGERKVKVGCQKKNIRKQWIEELVISHTKALLHNRELLEFIAENTYQFYLSENTDTAYTDALNANLKDIDKALGNLLRAVEAGIFNDTTKTRMNELEDQRKQIQAALARSKLQEGLQLTKTHILYYLEQFRDLNTDDTECRKRLIDTFINSIFVYDDKITITFNYSGDNRTVTLQEIDGGGFDCSVACSTI
ncbi:recombinase family protein [Butyricicoccus sp.]|uniref:recombinase family protein n=1 Tax=Butyricicoccus sp. TaxID=2049021 RepID=UPI003F1651C1